MAVEPESEPEPEPEPEDIVVARAKADDPALTTINRAADMDDTRACRLARALKGNTDLNERIVD